MNSPHLQKQLQYAYSINVQDQLNALIPAI
jgi:hypothetical protein